MCLRKIRTKFYCPTSLTIDKEASRIMKDNDTSLENKRLIFQNCLADYYKAPDSDAISSDELVRRIHEINYFENLERNVLLSAFIGAILGFVISILKMSLISCIVAVMFCIVTIIGFILDAKPLSDYEKLHLEQFERDMIEEVLSDRLKKVEDKSKTVTPTKDEAHAKS